MIKKNRSNHANANDINFTTVLSRLLSDSELRQKFSDDANAVLADFTLTENERTMLHSLNVVQLNTQAKILITKRLHEVQKIIPATFEFNMLLITREYLDYADTNWPNGLDKHYRDARDFCSYLKNNKIQYNKAELNRLTFKSRKRLFGLYFNKRLLIQGQYRAALQLLWRYKTRQFEFQFYFVF